MELSILQRLERMEAREDLMGLESRYCQYWDESRAAEWASLFTDDGLFERVDLPGRPGHVQQGRDQLEGFCRRLQAGYGRFHMLHTVDIQVHDAVSATSRITFECMTTATGDYPRPGLVTGFYDTRYVRQGSTWLIAAKRERQVFLSESAFYGVSASDGSPVGTDRSGS